MNKYIALLRGINVGGHRKVKMDDLRAFFSAMKFENVTTYIQSGNVVFDATETDPDQLASHIEERLGVALGFEVEVLIRTASDLQVLVDENPFEGRESNRHKLYVTFLKNEPTPKQKQKLCSLNNHVEEFRVINRELFSLIDKQADERPRFSNNFIEKHFGLSATTRNWRSVHKILELAEA